MTAPAILRSCLVAHEAAVHTCHRHLSRPQGLPRVFPNIRGCGPPKWTVKIMHPLFSETSTWKFEVIKSSQPTFGKKKHGNCEVGPKNQFFRRYGLVRYRLYIPPLSSEKRTGTQKKICWGHFFRGPITPIYVHLVPKTSLFFRYENQT